MKEHIKTQRSYSPLVLVEDIAYQKIKNTPFQIWHYYVALTALCIIPSLLPQNSALSLGLTYITITMAWISSRVIGRNLSRNKGTDSVLVYRYFALAPWLIAFITTGLSLLLHKVSDIDQLIYTIIFYLSIVVMVLHILGIVIHLKKNKSMVKNIKKDELFQ